MYQDFRIVSVDTDLKSKSVVITANFDIDPNSVNDANVQVYDRDHRNETEYTAEVVGKSITLVMKEWPQPNIEYIISIQNLTNVLGDALVSGVRRKIIFASSITSKVQITYPAFNEVITDLKLKWQETAVDPNQPLVNSYYIEISTEANFYNIVKKTEVQDRTEIDLTDVTKKQYYVRVRAQKDGEYGSWSDVVTFVVGDSADVPGPIFDDGDSSENEEPIFSADMQIVSAPANGETPTSFIIEFDCEVDPDSIEDIIVLRRRI